MIGSTLHLLCLFCFFHSCLLFCFSSSMWCDLWDGVCVSETIKKNDGVGRWYPHGFYLGAPPPSPDLSLSWLVSFFIFSFYFPFHSFVEVASFTKDQEGFVSRDTCKFTNEICNPFAVLHMAWDVNDKFLYTLYQGKIKKTRNVLFIAWQNFILISEKLLRR